MGLAGVMMAVVADGPWPGHTAVLGFGFGPILTPPDAPLLQGLLFCVGLVALVGGWVVVMRSLGAGRRLDDWSAQRQNRMKNRTVALAAVAIVWLVPVSLADPVLSLDAFSYAAQGEMAVRGLDPTSVGPSSLGDEAFTSKVSPMWLDAPAPYGPIAVRAKMVAVTVAGNDSAVAVGMMRFLALIGLAMAAIGAVALARQHGVEPALALAAGLLSPVVLLHMVGGSHNDALMVGLVTLGLAAFGSSFRVAAVMLLLAATAVKLPAGLALLFVAWNWNADPETKMRNRVVAVATVGVVALSGLAVASKTLGLGFGWLTALSSTGSTLTTFSPSTKVGLMATDLAQLAGLGVLGELPLAAARGVGMMVAAALVVWLVMTSQRRGVARSTGLALVAVMVAGPVLYPWYLVAGLVVLAATDLGRHGWTYTVFVGAVVATVWPAGINPGARPEGFLVSLGEFFVVAGIAAACWLTAQRVLLTTSRVPSSSSSLEDT